MSQYSRPGGISSIGEMISVGFSAVIEGCKWLFGKISSLFHGGSDVDVPHMPSSISSNYHSPLDSSQGEGVSPGYTPIGDSPSRHHRHFRG